MHKLLHWLFTVSFFHAAYEALAVNELRYLTVVDRQVRVLHPRHALWRTMHLLTPCIFRQAGVNLEIPAATVLSLFGLRAQWYWADVTILGSMFVIFTVLSFVFLHCFVKERR